MITPITDKDLYQLMLTFVRYPFDQICRHSAALYLFQLLEGKGFKPPVELAKSLVDASAGDQDSERILLELLSQESQQDENDPV